MTSKAHSTSKYDPRLNLERRMLKEICWHSHIVWLVGRKGERIAGKRSRFWEEIGGREKYGRIKVGMVGENMVGRVAYHL